MAFTRCYSATPTCIPARAALFTGQSQERHGRVGYQDGVDWDYPVTLPGELARAGYHTHCAGKMHVWPPRSLLGFHSVDLHDGFLPYRNTGTAARQWMGRIDDYLPYLQGAVGADATINDLGLGCNSWAARPWAGPEQGPPHQLDGDAVGRFSAPARPHKAVFSLDQFCGAPPAPGPPAPYFELYDRRALAPGHGGLGRAAGPGRPTPPTVYRRAERAAGARHAGGVLRADHPPGPPGWAADPGS